MKWFLTEPQQIIAVAAILALCACIVCYHLGWIRGYADALRYASKLLDPLILDAKKIRDLAAKVTSRNEE